MSTDEFPAPPKETRSVFIFFSSLSIRASNLFLLTYFLCTFEKQIFMLTFMADVIVVLTHKMVTCEECWICAVVEGMDLHSGGSGFDPLHHIQYRPNIVLKIECSPQNCDCKM